MQQTLLRRADRTTWTIRTRLGANGEWRARGKAIDRDGQRLGAWQPLGSGPTNGTALQAARRTILGISRIEEPGFTPSRDAKASARPAGV